MVKRAHRSRARPVSTLRPTHLTRNPIWRFVSSDVPDETWVSPISGRRTSSLVGKVVRTNVVFADGTECWALFGNVDPTNAELTEHFLALSLYLNGKWFHLARYHDVDVKTRGPRALAAALERRTSKVFPIRYDLRPFVRGDFPALLGVVRQHPRRRLTRAQIIAQTKAQAPRPKDERRRAQSCLSAPIGSIHAARSAGTSAAQRHAATIQSRPPT